VAIESGPIIESHSPQLALVLVLLLVLFSQLWAPVVRHKANDDVCDPSVV